MDHPAENQQRSLRHSKMAPHWYVLAIVVVIAATVIRLVFLGSLGTGVAFNTFYPAVMVAALYGGLWAGLLATALSAIAANFFFHCAYLTTRNQSTV
jgi:K+-sensing histidine kinase KdpD